MNATYTYTVKTDAGMTSVDAMDIDAAAVAWAQQDGEPAASAVTDLASLVAYVEGIDGAWLWVESDDAPDGDRVYAGRDRMPG